MIEALFAAALLDTVCVIDEPLWETVVVHEWGVVSMGEQLVASSVPAEYPFEFDTPGMLEDRAPVVTFYGSGFEDATFTVELHTGRFTDAFPLPEGSDLDGVQLQWQIDEAQDLGPLHTIPAELLPESRSMSGWAFDEWRDGVAHVLEFTDGTVDRFIYYECAIPFGPDDPLYPFDMGRGLSRGYNGPVLVFEHRPNGSMKVLLCGNDSIAVSSDLMEPYSRDYVIEVLCQWSAGRLKSEEVSDLWCAWEDWVLQRQWPGDRLLVFELPDRTMDGVSTLSLETACGSEVVIERFYLGMSPFHFTY